MSELALQRIAENKRTKDVFLDLENCGLAHLPEELFECTWLHSITLGNDWSKGNFNDYSNKDLSKLLALKDLKTLDLKYSRIADISFLQKLSGLQSLDLSDNQITDYSFLQKLSGLQSLVLSYNLITDISFLQKLSGLQSLVLSYNLITDISFLQKLSGLQSLDLSENQITDISFLQKLSGLQSLVLSENLITDISFLQKLSGLKSLVLSENLITDISFLQKLSGLQSLDLSYNLITDISFLQKLSGLKSLDLSYNQITDISFLQKLSGLKSLVLSYNQITDISFLQKLSGLKSLVLSYNQITDISFLQKLSGLQSLDLSSNQITDSNQIKELIKLIRLERLYLDENPLQIPKEIDANSLSALRGHFDDLELGSSNIRFVKFIMLGDGCAGKTTLLKHLKLGQPPEEISISERTHGIELDLWKNEFPNVEVSVWDFGGQEIFHGTHRLFLGQQAIYVLVWTKQENKKCSKDEKHPLTYWLDFIADYGEESTVLLVENTINDEFDSSEFPDDKALEDLVKDFKKRGINLIPTNHRINCQTDTKEVKNFKRRLAGEMENLTE
jgi:internalin A